MEDHKSHVELDLHGPGLHFSGPSSEYVSKEMEEVLEASGGWIDETSIDTQEQPER